MRVIGEKDAGALRSAGHLGRIELAGQLPLQIVSLPRLCQADNGVGAEAGGTPLPVETVAPPQLPAGRRDVEAG